MDDEETLLLLASKYLAPKLQKSAKLLIGDGAMTTVRTCILCAIDTHLFNGTVDYEEARCDYKLLGFSPEDACRARQKAARPYIIRPQK